MSFLIRCSIYPFPGQISSFFLFLNCSVVRHISKEIKETKLINHLLDWIKTSSSTFFWAQICIANSPYIVVVKQASYSSDAFMDSVNVANIWVIWLCEGKP